MYACIDRLQSTQHEPLAAAILTGKPSPLWLAADEQLDDLVEFLLKLLKKCPRSTWPYPSPSPDGQTCLEAACGHGNRKIMKMLFDSTIFVKEEFQRVCEKFGKHKFLQDNFGFSPLITMSYTFPQFNEKVVDGAGVKIPSR